MAGTDNRTSKEGVQPLPWARSHRGWRSAGAQSRTLWGQGAALNPTTFLAPSPESGQEQPQGHQSLFLTGGFRNHLKANTHSSTPWANTPGKQDLGPARASKVTQVTQISRERPGEQGTHRRKALPGYPSLLPPFLWPLCLQNGAETGAGFGVPWYRCAHNSHGMEKATGIQGMRRGQCHPSMCGSVGLQQ